MVEKTDVSMRTIRAYFIKARGIIPHQEAGYTEAILSLSSSEKALAKGGETIYVCCPPIVKKAASEDQAIPQRC
jgi:hypothetical protein